jgi:pimeloyl-ACP methyl ester carboxylesterase
VPVVQVPGDSSSDPSEPPEWFRAALATEPEPGESLVAGARIVHYAWGPAGAPGVVLVHGGSAHAHWWDHVAPLLATSRRVVALDLSGHGDSDRREKYSLDLWAQEAFQVARAAGLAPRPIIVGHSMGGFVSLRAGAVFGSELTGVVAIDSPMHRRTPEETAAYQRRAFGPLRVYPTFEHAMSRFRPVPGQGLILRYAMEHVARHSIRPAEGGWSWKFDPKIFGRDRSTPVADRVLDCRVALFRAEHGLLTAADSDFVYGRLGRRAPVVELPDANHHVMLDRPLVLVAALRTLLADWEHSVPIEGTA